MLVEGDTFRFEEALLLALAAVDAEADLALGVDDSMPGDVNILGRGVQGVADLAGMAAEAGKFGDLAVGRDLAPGDAANDGVDALVVAGFGGRAGHGALAERCGVSARSHPTVGKPMDSNPWAWGDRRCQRRL